MLACNLVKKMLKKMKNYLFTSESVSEGHPDKVADQISDAILDEFLRQDPEAKVACETFCTTGLVVVGGEVTSEHAYVDIPATVRRVIDRIGYNKAEYRFDAASCGILSALHEQSPDINRGVERTLQVLAGLRHNSPQVMPYLRPDAKCQYTIEYDGQTGRPVRIHTIVLSTQHDEFASDEDMLARIRTDVKGIVLPRVQALLPDETAALFDGNFTLHVNPTGKFVIGGPHGDTGLTGRKIIVDTYGGKGAHGGGAFSGKDPSKVDRSAAYMARYIAKNLVAAGVADEILVQLAYAIGVARPVSVFVNTYGTGISGHSDGEIAEKIQEIFDLRPGAIIARFGLKNPIYEPTAAYGHMGRKPYVQDGIQFFGWEKLDAVDAIRTAFSL